MLGTLAKWLRIYGFDTFYASSDIKDSELLKISKDENRMLLTRDKELIIQAKRENIKTLEIKSTDIDKALSGILSDIKIDKKKILSRCILCNSIVEEIKKEIVKEKVPERVYNNNEKYWYCKKCNKIYWKGSHFEKMKEKIDNLS
jgi:uncharacterized protein with PIN domain